MSQAYVGNGSGGGGGTDLHVARFIVSPGGSADGANYTTIASAYAAAVTAGAPQTVFIQPGTFTENISLTPGIDLSAFGSDSSLNATGNVIINGTLTASSAGSTTISGIQLQTNSADVLDVTGSEPTVVNLQNCFINCLNNNGITFSSSSSSAAINMFNCEGDVGSATTSFAMSSAGTFNLRNTNWTNSGGSTSYNIISAGNFNAVGCNLRIPIESTATTNFSFLNSSIDTSSINHISLLVSGNSGPGTALSSFSSFASGTASSIEITGGGTLNLSSCLLNSNASSGFALQHAGSGNFCIIQGVLFGGTARLLDPTNITYTGGVMPSISKAATSGFIGFRSVSTIAQGSAVSLTTATPTNVTSITIGPGVFDITALVGFTGSPTGTAYQASITSTTGGTGTLGDSSLMSVDSPTSGSDTAIVIPTVRIVLSTSTTYYMTAEATFSLGSVSAYGRLSAVCVG